MSLYLPRGKRWQKVEGQIKVVVENSIFINSTNDWLTASTLIPFPLEVSENLEEIFTNYIEYDLNSKKNHIIKVVACKDLFLK
jgi:hypothetical protein